MIIWIIVFFEIPIVVKTPLDTIVSKGKKDNMKQFNVSHFECFFLYKIKINTDFNLHNT